MSSLAPFQLLFSFPFRHAKKQQNQVVVEFKRTLCGSIVLGLVAFDYQRESFLFGRHVSCLVVFSEAELRFERLFRLRITDIHLQPSHKNFARFIELEEDLLIVEKKGILAMIFYNPLDVGNILREGIGGRGEGGDNNSVQISTVHLFAY